MEYSVLGRLVLYSVVVIVMKEKNRKKGSKRSYAGKETNPLADRMVIGRRSVEEVLRHKLDQIECIYLTDNKNSKTANNDSLIALINSCQLPVEELTADQLTEMTGTASHQSYAVLLKKRSFVPLKDFLAGSQKQERSLVILLDSVADPQNFGSILRSAECFGVDAVIWSKNRGSGVTPVVTKTSVGGTELVPLIELSNLSDSLKKLKKAGYWAVASSLGPGSSELDKFQFPDKTVLLVGAEGKGLSDLLLKESDYLIKIPMLGKIQSLNVSQATAIILYAARRAD